MNLGDKMETLKENLDQVKLKKVDLGTSFREECQDPIFKKFVSKIKLPTPVLCKYTSLLKLSSEEFNNCQNCPGLVACQNQINGFAYLPKVNNQRLEFRYKACNYQLKKEEQLKYLDNIYLFDIPEEIKQASMSEIYTNDKKRFEVIKWLKEFIDDYENKVKGLYLYGSFGCGKTYLIAAMFNELAKKNIKSAIIYWPEYLRDLKSSFNSDYNIKVNYIKKVPFLLIDDIGAETVTTWNRDEILGPIVQYRMQAKLPTFFTSNLDMASLEKHLSVSKDEVDSLKARRIIERIKQLTENKEMVSKNLRN